MLGQKIAFAGYSLEKLDLSQIDILVRQDFCYQTSISHLSTQSSILSDSLLLLGTLQVHLSKTYIYHQRYLLITFAGKYNIHHPRFSWQSPLSRYSLVFR
jgi:hypothetical protein